METNVERRRKRSASAESIKNAYNGANHVEVEVIEAADAALPDNTPKEMRVCAYECDKAMEAGIKIVVLYNSSRVERFKCPEAVRFRGTHVAMHNNGRWDYQAVRDAIMY